MGKEAIIERILSDAKAESEEIVRVARARAEEIVAAANARAAEERAETEAELKELTERILDVNAAATRLDGAKILLAEKRRVIETVYAKALENLLSLGERESVLFLERLLKEHAEPDDEIVFDENFAYREGAAKLPVVGERNLKICPTSAKLGGGCILRGKRSDKDISYPALLRLDMEQYQSALAARLFADQL